MNIFFRVDASAHIGTGHVMRCAALAQALQRYGADAFFLCRELPDPLEQWLKQRRIHVLRLQSEHSLSEIKTHLTARQADWLVVDHYRLDEQFESSLRPWVQKIFVIDDLADRKHDCDLLLDQNLYDAMETRYKTLVPPHCRQLLGPGYALLREEFSEQRTLLQRRFDSFQRILISFGGSDEGNETGKVLEALLSLSAQNLLQDISIDVITGTANPNQAQLQNLANTLPHCSVHTHVDNIAERMSRADLFIGAGGTTTWERCCLGLPAIIITIADNQEALSITAHKQDLAVYLGRSQEIMPTDIINAVLHLKNTPALRSAISQNGMQTVEGQGCQRVAKALLEFPSLTTTIGMAHVKDHEQPQWVSAP